MNWVYNVKLKHLFTKDEDYQSIQDSMNKIADVLDKEQCFDLFPAKNRFRTLPDDYTLVIANSLINELYDYADAHRIWID
jgi:hypothetical protein